MTTLIRIPPIEVLKRFLKDTTYDYKDTMAYVNREHFLFIRRKMNECGNTSFPVLVRNSISVQA